MDKNHAKDLFQLQSELVDSKVDMAVSKAIERVMDELSGIRKDMHSFKHEVHVEMHSLRRDMDKQFASLGESLGQRVTAVESTLTFIKDTQHQISTKFIEYTFKAGWFMLAASISYLVAHYFGLIR